MLLDLGFRYDVVDAVMTEKGSDPYGAHAACEELTTWVNRPGLIRSCPPSVAASGSILLLWTKNICVPGSI